jgi:hypothetical protein
MESEVQEDLSEMIEGFSFVIPITVSIYIILVRMIMVLSKCSATYYNHSLFTPHFLGANYNRILAQLTYLYTLQAYRWALIEQRSLFQGV